MKASRPRASRIVLFAVLGLGFLLSGCKKEAPPQEPGAPPVSTQEQAAKEKEFLADADVVTCELESTTISKLDIPKERWPSFVRRMEQQSKEGVKQGTITLAGRPFKVLLGQNPQREFYLYDVEKKFGPYWWGSWSLHSYHKIDDAFYEFMTLDAGRKIATRPYKGEVGLIKVGRGGRELEKVEFSGSVHQAGYVSAPIGTLQEYTIGPVPECEIPVGDYSAYLIHLTYDNLAIDISNNYHTNAQGVRNGNDIVYGMKVGRDTPCVIDFSNEPMVIFDEPTADQTSFRRGAQIQFAAVLIDPKLDIMIRGLNDTSVKVDKEYKDRDGKVIHTARVDKPLDPKVVIARADGEVIAEGVMPFG
jgi:hypothetical protein